MQRERVDGVIVLDNGAKSPAKGTRNGEGVCPVKIKKSERKHLEGGKGLQCETYVGLRLRRKSPTRSVRECGKRVRGQRERGEKIEGMLSPLLWWVHRNYEIEQKQ